MAIMSEKPRKFALGSLEGEMFSALEKLPDGYFVFHSFRITEVANDILQESETDFVIFHAGKGVLCGGNHPRRAGGGSVRAVGGRLLRWNVLSADHEADRPAPGPQNRVSVPVQFPDRDGKGHFLSGQHYRDGDVYGDTADCGQDV